MFFDPFFWEFLEVFMFLDLCGSLPCIYLRQKGSQFLTFLFSDGKRSNLSNSCVTVILGNLLANASQIPIIPVAIHNPDFVVSEGLVRVLQ